MNASRSAINVHTEIGDIARSVRSVVRKGLLPLGAVLALETLYLLMKQSPYATGFAMIALGVWIALAAWQQRGLGLPLLPVLIVQHLVAFGLPIATNHSVLSEYPASYVSDAGLEVLVFCGAAILTWWITLQVFRPGTTRSFALRGFRNQGDARLMRVGICLVIVASAYQVAITENALDFLFSSLPAGSFSLLTPIIAAASSCGFFVLAISLGTNPTIGLRLFFWSALALNCVVSASSFLLSSTTQVLAAVFVGLFWSKGRIPWRYVAIVIALLSFFNLGKSTMRERYWPQDQTEPPKVTWSQLPAYYREWFDASLAMIGAEPVQDAIISPSTKPARQTLLERINNLQNLLFVINAVNRDNIPTLGGATYEIIPSLLIPRVFWPDKPRSHEGQVLLNVHFGRQDIHATFVTYIAWGLLAEAYGNFGPITGAVLLGVFIGVLCSWIENVTARKLLLSLEGFISFTVILGVIGSFEMVASVLVTMIFQSIVPIVLASIPFVERVDTRRGPPAASTAERA
jgi:hypothetical protein